MTKVWLLTLPLTLGACATTGKEDGMGGSSCRADAAAVLVGRAAPGDDAIIRVTGGTTVRRLAPGDPATRDFRVERVTVTIVDGKVVAASCG